VRIVAAGERRGSGMPSASKPPTRTGPIAPMWSQTLEEPGPPLKAYVTGRVPGARALPSPASSSNVYAMWEDVGPGLALSVGSVR
jgi:hypothetical protein